MAAESPKRTMKYSHTVIRPHAFSDKSVMESVVDFISDVVPQAYCGNQKFEDKEKIQWVRFENTDGNDLANNPDFNLTENKGIPLLLILGYSNGVQIWNITPNGEAQETLSLRQGPIKIFRVLPTPTPVFTEYDPYSVKRPLAAVCDTSSAGQPYCSVKFVSLRTGDEVHNVSFKTLTVHGIECNKRVMVVVFQEKLCVFDSCTLTQLFWVTSCFPSTGPNYNPVALGTRWLAYADKRLVPLHQSCGGMSGDGAQSYAATVISAAKGAFKGLTMFGEAIVSNVTGANKPAPPTKKVENVVDNGHRPGIVSIIDVQSVNGDHFCVTEENECEGLIAHFHAHANEPVAAMNFDVTGTLLLTACKLGHNFHVFRIMAHPCSSSLGAVHHLYTLHRGDTTAKVIDMSFSQDSRWVTVNTHRGTTHVFPITPYGGTVNLRTHCSPRVVNRASRYHKSAGLDETDYTTSARRSPVLSGSPGSSAGQYDNYPSLLRHNAINNSMGNPRLPPFPHPTTIYPLAQIKQPLNLVTTIGGTKTQSPTHSSTGADNIISVSSCFCTPRLWVGGSPNLSVDKREERRAVDSLFVVNHLGTVVEYVLEPKPKTGASEKISDESMLDLAVTGYTQWNLQRSKTSEEVKPPLANNNPLMLAADAVRTQQPTSLQDLGELAPVTRHDSKDSLSSEHSNKDTDIDEQWLSQVEIFTHVGPHRRLWMGPQFAFKTYQNVQNTTVLSPNSSALLSQSPEANLAAMDIVTDDCDLESLKIQPTRSSPVAMPNSRPAYRRQAMGSDSTPPPGKGPNTPLLIEAGSFDQSPNLCDVYSSWAESTVAKQPRGSEEEEDRIKETLAEAMLESPLKESGPSCIRNGSKVSSEGELGKSRNEKGRKKSGKKSSDLSSVEELNPSEAPEGSRRKNISENRLDPEKSKSDSSRKDGKEAVSRNKSEKVENLPCQKVELDKASNIASKKSKKSKKGKDECKDNPEKVTDVGVRVSSDKNVGKDKLQENKDLNDSNTHSKNTEDKKDQSKSESLKESTVNFEKENEHKVKENEYKLKLAKDKMTTSKANSDTGRVKEDSLKKVSVETTKNLVKMVDKCTEIVKMVDKGTEIDLKLDAEAAIERNRNKTEKIQMRSDEAGEEVFIGPTKGKSVQSKKEEQRTTEDLHDIETQEKGNREKGKKTKHEVTKLDLGSSTSDHGNSESTDELKANSKFEKHSKKKHQQKSNTDYKNIKEQTEDMGDEMATPDGNTNESASSYYTTEMCDGENTDKLEQKLFSLGSGDVKNVTGGYDDVTSTDVNKRDDENLGWDSVKSTSKRSKSKNKKESSPVPLAKTEVKKLNSKSNVKQETAESASTDKRDESLECSSVDTTGESTKSKNNKESSLVPLAKTDMKKLNSRSNIKQETTDLAATVKRDEDLECSSVDTAGENTKSKKNKESPLVQQAKSSIDTTGESTKTKKNKESSPVQPANPYDEQILNSNNEHQLHKEIQEETESTDIEKIDGGNSGLVCVETAGEKSKSKSKKASLSVLQILPTEEPMPEEEEQNVTQMEKARSSCISYDTKSEKGSTKKSKESKRTEKDPVNTTNKLQDQIGSEKSKKCDKVVSEKAESKKKKVDKDTTEEKSQELDRVLGEKIASEGQSESNEFLGKSGFAEKQQSSEMISKECAKSSSLNKLKHFEQDNEVSTKMTTSCGQAKSKRENLDIKRMEPTKCEETIVSENGSQKAENGKVFKVKKSGKKGKKSAAPTKETNPSNDDSSQKQRKDVPENVSDKLPDSQTEVSNSSRRSDKSALDAIQDKNIAESEESDEVSKQLCRKSDVVKDDENFNENVEIWKETLPEVTESKLESPSASDIKLQPSKKWAWGNVASSNNITQSQSNIFHPSKSKLENEEFPSLVGGGIQKKDLKNEDEFPSFVGGGIQKKDLRNEEEFPSLVGNGIQKKDLRNEDEFPSLVGGGIQKKDLKNADEFQILVGGGSKEKKAGSAAKNVWGKMKSGDKNDIVTSSKGKAKNKSDIDHEKVSCDMNIDTKEKFEDCSIKCTSDKVEKKFAWGSFKNDGSKDKIKEVDEIKPVGVDNESANGILEASVQEVELKCAADEDRKESSEIEISAKCNGKSTVCKSFSANSKSESVGDMKGEILPADNNNSGKKKTKGKNKKVKMGGKWQEEVMKGSRQSSPDSDVCDKKLEAKDDYAINVKLEKVDKTAKTELSKANDQDSTKTDDLDGKSSEGSHCIEYTLPGSDEIDKQVNNQINDDDTSEDVKVLARNSNHAVETELDEKELGSSVNDHQAETSDSDHRKLSSKEESLDANVSSSDSVLITGDDKSPSNDAKGSVNEAVLMSGAEKYSSTNKADNNDIVEGNPEAACSGTQKRDSTPEYQSGKSNSNGKRNGKNKKKNKKGW